MLKSCLEQTVLFLTLFNCIRAFHISVGNSKRTIIATSFQKVINKNHEASYLKTIGTNNMHYKNDMVLFAASGDGGGKKKRRRKRKTTKEPIVSKEETSIDTTSIDEKTLEKVETISNTNVDNKGIGDKDYFPIPAETENKIDTAPTFKFNRDEAIALGISDADEEDDDILMPLSDMQDSTATTKAPANSKIDFSKGAIDLPNLKETVINKVKPKNMQKAEKYQFFDKVVEDKPSDKPSSKKISREDKESFKQLLEVEPQADSDKTYFEDESYGIVSALLGEGSKKFLGIPSNVLQIGHFFGTLSFLIMAFIQYPGFPLTNLPTPLRDTFQGGLVTIYAINLVLAILCVFEAPKRGQPSTLWAVKTFTLGGLAYDQLTQIPTTEEIQRQKSVKGKRGRRR